MKCRWKGFQSVLAADIEQFIRYKRSLRRKYDGEEKALRLFDRFLQEVGVNTLCDITPLIIDDFLASRPRQRPRSYNHLLCTVRRLFDWMVVQGILEQSPVLAQPIRKAYQRSPFIFVIPTAKKLLAISRTLPDRSRAPMRGETYYSIFAILYGLGLRVSEVCHLKVCDIDFERAVLVIRQTKFYKSRLVPFGPKMASHISEYLQLKKERFGELSPDEPLFSFTKRGAINPCTVSQTFHHLVPQLQLDIPLGCSPPRLHDLRHSFAVGTLTRWYRTGVDPATKLIELATFLGHVDANSTSVYLTVTKTLLREGNKRFERFAAPLLDKGLRQ